MGDDLKLWAVFERSNQLTSEMITAGRPEYVAQDNKGLADAMLLLGLHRSEQGG